MGRDAPDHQLVPFQNVARSMVRVLEFQRVAAMSFSRYKFLKTGSGLLLKL